MDMSTIHVQDLLHRLRSAAESCERTRLDLDGLLASQAATKDSAGPRLRLWIEILGQEAFAGGKARAGWLTRAKTTGMSDPCQTRLHACLDQPRGRTKPSDELIEVACADLLEAFGAPALDQSVVKQLTAWIVEFAEDSARANAVRQDLIQYAAQRIEILSRKMLRSKFEAIRAHIQTGDVFVEAVMRLRRALCHVAPADPNAFFGLASLQIRRELIDLVRSVKRDLPPAPPTTLDLQPVAQDDNRILDCWTRFHTAVERLPPEQKEVVDLHWYQGLTLEEIAQFASVDRSTIKRRWRIAREALAAELDDCAGIMKRE